MPGPSCAESLLAFVRPDDPALAYGRRDLVIEAGAQELCHAEQMLVHEPVHRDELRRGLREAEDAVQASGSLPGDWGVPLWASVREAWRERHAALIAAKCAVLERGDGDPEATAALQAAVQEHLEELSCVGTKTPWEAPGPDAEECTRFGDGMHVIDARVAEYAENLGSEGSSLRAVGQQAAEEIRRDGRSAWTRWTAAARPNNEPPPWERWRNRALFPIILARMLWHGEIESRLARTRAKPPGTIYAVFRSIARISSPQLELGLDDQGRQAILRRDRGHDRTIAVADVPSLPEEVFTHGLKLLGSCYTLPTVEWLVEHAHAQALQRADRPDIIEIEGGWQAFTSAVLEKPLVHPRERSAVRTLVRMLGNTPIRWQDGSRSSSLFLVYEDPEAAGRGRGRSIIQFTLDGRLLDHEYHRARKRFGPGAGPAQSADWRIVPLPRPRNVAPIHGSPHDTYGPQAVALRLLWLFFTRHGNQLLEPPRLVQVPSSDQKAIADEAQLPTRLIEPLLANLVRQGAIVGGPKSRFAPADSAARAFIADGWRRSRLASENGQRAAQARASGRAPRIPKVSR